MRKWAKNKKEYPGTDYRGTENTERGFIKIHMRELYLTALSCSIAYGRKYPGRSTVL
jgi:hypothetical protein